MHKDIKEILYAESEIKARVAEIGGALTDKYSEIADAGEPVVLVSVLRGAAIFMADLARATEIPLEMDYMALSSYGSGTKSSGVVKIVKDLTSSIEGKHVIIAEDILDSGLTLQFLQLVKARSNTVSYPPDSSCHQTRSSQTHRHRPQWSWHCRYCLQGR